MSACARKPKFVNIYKSYVPLTYNPEIGTEASACESDSEQENEKYTKTIK